MVDVPGLASGDQLILSCDPGGIGGHTGIVLLRAPTNGPVTLEDSWAVPDDMDGFLAWYDRIGGALKPDVVICEHFVNRNIKGADLTPCFIEGAVRALWRNVVLQPASGKNTAVPNHVLERLGFPKSVFKGDHHSDRYEALRHAVWYLKARYHQPTLEAFKR